jgi:hypothetical protein
MRSRSKSIIKNKKKGSRERSSLHRIKKEGSRERSSLHRIKKEGSRERSSLHKTIGNSPTFYRRSRSIGHGKRVPKKYEGENPAHHSDLFTDENPIGTVHNLKIKNENEAKKSVQYLKKLLQQNKITYAHASQITNTLIQRAKYHAHQTPDMKQGGKIWEKFKKEQLSKYK